MASGFPAVVAYAPIDGHPTWKYENIQLMREVNAHELQIRMVATGICHTDVFVASLPPGALGLGSYPKILGHEGAGYVEAVGSKVTVAEVGDPVLLSYDYCQKCELCSNGEQTYCDNFALLNNIGETDLFQTIKEHQDTPGKFFGQSSFASRTIVQENSVVNVRGLVQDENELKLLSPLGCGLMTGAGAVLNSAKAQPHDGIVVSGIGAVGLGVIMAARILGCKAIIAVDRVPSRLELARQLGATHVVDTGTLEAGTDIVQEVQKLANGQRIKYAIDTTGVPAVMSSVLSCLGKKGKLIQIGVPPLDSVLSISMGEFFFQTKSFEINYLGNALARDLLPKMIGWWREGIWPIEKLVVFFAAKDVEKALRSMEDGSAIKPVIVW